jgi:hypothetical protein
MLFSKKRKIDRLYKKIKLLKAARQAEQTSDASIKKEINYYLQLAKLFEKLKYNKSYPYAGLTAVECFRAAASLDDAEANYILGKYLLEEAKYRASLQSQMILDSTNNEARAISQFKEAHAYLQHADNLKHVQAKRLRGLCYINGWGVRVDENEGFELVVKSIEQEGSWDKVPEIFESMGLNKPEFFAAIMQRRKKINNS